MTHRAPSATAGGAFAFSGSVATSTYHVPVLADVVRAWAEGSRRAVDATLGGGGHAALLVAAGAQRSEEHTSELQSRLHLLCRLLLEKKKKVDEHALDGIDAPIGRGAVSSALM